MLVDSILTFNVTITRSPATESNLIIHNNFLSAGHNMALHCEGWTAGDCQARNCNVNDGEL